MENGKGSSDAPAVATASAKSTRRKWFRRIGIATVLTGIAAGIGWKAYAHGHGWHRGGWHGEVDPARVEKGINRGLRHFYAEIDATEEQKQKLAPIVKGAVKDMLPVREKMRSARKEAVDLMNRENIDRVAIERLRVEQMRLAEDVSKRLAQALGDAADVLTPAQRRGLAERFERFGRRWGRA